MNPRREAAQADFPALLREAYFLLAVFDEQQVNGFGNEARAGAGALFGPENVEGAFGFGLETKERVAKVAFVGFGSVLFSLRHIKDGTI